MRIVRPRIIQLSFDKPIQYIIRRLKIAPSVHTSILGQILAVRGIRIVHDRRTGTAAQKLLGIRGGGLFETLAPFQRDVLGAVLPVVLFPSCIVGRQPFFVAIVHVNGTYFDGLRVLLGFEFAASVNFFPSTVGFEVEDVVSPA